MTQYTIETPDSDDLRSEGSAIVTQANGLVVTTKAEDAVAQDLWKACSDAEKKVHKRLDFIVKQANDTHKSLTTLRRELIKPFAEGKAIIGRKCGEYEREERRKAEKKAREIAEKERKAEEERQLLAAVQAEDEGDAEAAEEIINEPIQVPTVVVKPEVAETAGVGRRTSWHAEVTDLKALIKYVSENDEWLSLVQVNMSALNGLARSQKGKLRIPGVKAVEERDFARSRS